LILAISVIGAFAENGSVVDLYLMLIFGVLGYTFDKIDIPIPPLLLAVVLGEMMEQSCRRALTISDGDPTIFVSSPICVALLLMATVSVVSPFIFKRLKRNPAVAEVLASNVTEGSERLPTK
jgi:putative tricarboxylic transport membrane protein